MKTTSKGRIFIPLKLIFIVIFTEAWGKTCSILAQQSRHAESSIQTPRNDYSLPSSTGREPEDFNVTATPNSGHQRRHEVAI